MIGLGNNVEITGFAAVRAGLGACGVMSPASAATVFGCGVQRSGMEVGVDRARVEGRRVGLRC